MEIPKQGDLIWIDAEPHSGHEQGGHDPKTGNIQRPMVVLSNDGYNQKVGMVVCMPITHLEKTDKRIYYPITDFDSGIKGNVITYQIPNFDFIARHGRIVGHVKPRVLNDLLNRAKQIF